MLYQTIFWNGGALITDKVGMLCPLEFAGLRTLLAQKLCFFSFRALFLSSIVEGGTGLFMVLIDMMLLRYD